MPRPLLATLACALVIVTTACGSSSSSGGDGGRLRVEAAFYPLAWVTEQVGGTDVEVSTLTPPGAEPHDLELSPADVGRVQDADLVVKLDGFQPAIDEATATLDDRVFDAATATDLDLTIAQGDDKGVDPHFWLDPTKLAEVATALGERLAELDPDHAEQYRQRATATATQLTSMDESFARRLESCASGDLVTSHAAFGYLAARYGFEQQGISGLSPSQEPSPKRLAELADFVDENDVQTIYFETLASDDVAQTLATETGAKVAVLDPIEGITDQSKGDDYPEVMAANLAALQRGQGCT